MRYPIRVLLPLLLLFASGCVAAGETWATVDTDGGAWTIEVDTAWTTGWQDIDVSVVDTSSDAPVCGLAVEADVTMPSMGHGSDEPVTVLLRGDGVYRVRAHFQMEGPWELTATLDDGDTIDTVAVDLDVVGG